MDFDLATGPQCKTIAIGRTFPFAMQFISLFLMILTFFAGALCRPKTDEASAAPSLGLVAVPNQADITVLGPIGRMSLKDVFIGENGEIDRTQFDGVFTALRSHDLRATFRVLEPAPFGASYSISRAVALSRFLERHDVPMSSWEVLAVNQSAQDGTEIEIQFAHEREFP